MQSLLPNEQRAKSAEILIWIVLVMKVVLFFNTYNQFTYLSSASFDRQSVEKLESMISPTIFLSVVYMILFLIAGIMFIQWFRRAYFNLHMRVKNLEYSEGWAAGGWFVPIVGYFVPYVIMKDLYTRSEAYLKEHYEGYIPWLSLTTIGIWWGLWVVSNVLSTIESIMIRTATSLDTLVLSAKISMVQSLIFIPAGLLAIKVIRNYSSTEDFLYATEPKIQLPPIPGTDLAVQ